MKATQNKMLTALAVFAMVLTMTISGCKKEDTVELKKTTYNLKVKDQIGISGTVTFIETSSTITTVDIVLTGSSPGDHPAHIHLNSALEGGAIAISLNPVLGGRSVTLVSKLDNNTTINYTQLTAFDGYLNVHESSSALGTIIAQTDIGGNALTSTSKSYTLNAVNASGVSGTALFEKRVNGNSLVTITLNGTIDPASHPALIHVGSVATVGGGPTVKTLNAVDGASGLSITNLRVLDDATPITYDNLLLYAGYLAIHESSTNLGTVLCQGDIGTH